MLGGELTQPQAAIWALSIRSQPLGVELRLRLAPGHGAVELTPQRDKRAGPHTLGTITFYGIVSAQLDPGEGEVRFRTADQPPRELIVSRLGQFRVVSGIHPDRVKPVPKAAVPQPKTIVGYLARPKFSEEQGRAYFNAGLAEPVDGTDNPIWYDVKCWGSLARHCRQFQRGQKVRVTGTPREERGEKNGLPYIYTSLIVTAMEAVG